VKKEVVRYKKQLESRGFQVKPTGGDHLDVRWDGARVNACHTLLVMEHVGLGRGRLFPGSYSAWSNRPELPVAGGS